MKKYYFVSSFLFFLLIQSCQVPSTNKVQNSSLEESKSLADSHSETFSFNPFQKEDYKKALSLYEGVIETWQDGLHPAEISFEGQEQNSRRTKRSLLFGTIAWYLSWKATISAESWEMQPTRQQEKQGTVLKAWYYPYSSFWSSGAKKTAIVSHWLSGDSGEMGAHLGVFSELGFNVLVPDLRGHGRSKDESDFKHRTVGICDGQDLVDWVREIHKRDPSQKIVVFGVSLGAISALKMASLLEANEVKAIVADSVFAELKEFLEDDGAVNHLVNSIDPPFISSKEEMLRVEKEFEGILFDNLGIKVSEGLTKQDLENAQLGLPLFIIQGQEDKIMPMYMAENAQKHYEKSGNKVEIWKVEGADHARSIFDFSRGDHFNEYKQKIKEFLEKYASL